MYCPDVVSLKQFYASETGRAASRMIWYALRDFWPELAGDALLAYGYCVPFIMTHAGGQELLAVAMPSQQGALYWPPAKANRVLLTEEDRLPFVDNAFNRILIVHALEHTDQLLPLMRELWRVLTPGGHVLAVVPNRHGLWSHAADSPFGSGRPYSVAQMRELFAQGGLTYLRHTSALFMPPTRARFLHRIAFMIEVFGRMAFPGAGGVLLVEAEKQIYAGLREPTRTRARMPLPVAVGVQPAFTGAVRGA